MVSRAEPLICHLSLIIGHLSLVEGTMSIDKSAISEVSLLTEQDLYLFNEGSHVRLYEKMGAHPIVLEGTLGTYFAEFAPKAGQVFLMGDLTGGNKSTHPNSRREDSGRGESDIRAAA